MVNHEHAAEFAGKPITDYDPEQGLKEPGKYHYRIGFGDEAYDTDEPLTDMIASFVNEPGAEKVTGIVIGACDEIMSSGDGSGSIVKALAKAKDKLPGLKAVFIGDIIAEEWEISWIVQSDVSPLFSAYPKLEHFRVRGNEELSLGLLRSDSLKSLVIETGGLGALVVQQVCRADLPALEHLELWLGTDNYGGDSTINDLEPILSGRLFPKLKYLGLRDSTYTDEIAIKAADSPVTEQVKILDLSLGTLSDKGAEALLASPAVCKLEKLDIHHHYLSNEMIGKFERSDINADVSGQEEDDHYEGEIYRYPAVTE